jgi:hypothetical protein
LASTWLLFTQPRWMSSLAPSRARGGMKSGGVALREAPMTLTYVKVLSLLGSNPRHTTNRLPANIKLGTDATTQALRFLSLNVRRANSSCPIASNSFKPLVLQLVPSCLCLRERPTRSRLGSLFWVKRFLAGSNQPSALSWSRPEPKHMYYRPQELVGTIGKLPETIGNRNEMDDGSVSLGMPEVGGGQRKALLFLVRGSTPPASYYI